MRYAVALAFNLAVLWLALSGVYKPLIVMLGAASVFLVVWLSMRMKVVGLEHNPVLFSWRLPVYWSWLLGQIVRANLHVAACVLRPAGRIRPRLVEVPVPHREPVAKVTYANSCTLTPGTVSLLLEPNRLTVHALTEKAASACQAGEMARRIQWLETGS